MIEILPIIASTLMSGLSVVLLKKGLDLQETKGLKSPISNILHLFTNKWWFTGGVFMLSGWLLRFISIQIADISYVRMIYVSHIVVVVIGSKLLVKEGFNRSLIVSVLVILSGLLFVAFSPPLTRSEIGDIQNYVYFFIVLLVVLIITLLITILKASTRRLFYAISSATSFGLGAVTQGLFAVNNFQLSYLTVPSFYFSLLSQPLVYFMILFSLSGFILGNLMFYRFKISLTYSIAYPLTEIIILIGSVIIFGDDLSIITNPFRIIGIILMMTGLAITLVTQRQYLVNPLLTKTDG